MVQKTMLGRQNFGEVLQKLSLVGLRHSMGKQSYLVV
jgi:hypothetical protein